MMWCESPSEGACLRYLMKCAIPAHHNQRTKEREDRRTSRPTRSVYRTRGPGHQGTSGLQDLETGRPKEQGSGGQATNGRKDQEARETRGPN